MDNRPVGRTPPSRILVVGASGYFGSLLVEDLLRHTDADVWAAGRGRHGMAELLRRVGPGLSGRLTPCVCDLAQPASVEALVPQVRAAICAAGPYQGLPLTLLESCVKHAVPYLDLADDRGFFVKARQRVARQDEARLPAVCVGWSAVPALSGLLARMAAEGMERLDALFVQIAPGNRSPRNKGTVASLLASLGKSCRLWREGEWRDVPGWSEPRTFPFPLPVGPRRGYIVDVPDHEIFPALFHARRVEFRVGAELSILNHGASALAWLSRRLAIQWAPFAPWLTPAMGALGLLGHDWGAVGVEAFGVEAGLPVRRQVCVVAGSSGQRIPVLPAAVMAARLLSGEWGETGLVRVDRWLSRAELASECGKRGLDLTVRELP
jgi:saccharopine dehydrogenase-like NADP-dependent oxidoreductase